MLGPVLNTLEMNAFVLHRKPRRWYCFLLTECKKRKTGAQALRVGEGARVLLRSQSSRGGRTGPQGQGAGKGKVGKHEHAQGPGTPWPPGAQGRRGRRAGRRG